MELSGEGIEKIKKCVQWEDEVEKISGDDNKSSLGLSGDIIEWEDEIEMISGDDNKSSRSISGDIIPSLGADPCKLNLRHFTVSPFDKRYRAWEGLLMLLVFYTAWVCPIEFGSIKKSHGALSITDNIVNCFFAIDIVLRFFVAYLDNATSLLVDDRNKIAQRYVKSWFVLDVLSIIPTAVTQSILPNSVATYGYFALLRLWRLRRACKMFAGLEKDRNYNYFWIIFSKLICVTLFAVHSAACFMIEAAKLAASYSNFLVEECKKRVEELEIQTSESKRLEKSSPEFTESLIKQLEESNSLLHDAKSEISSLKEKISLLEISNKRRKADFEEAEYLLGVAKEEASKLQEEVKSLKSELKDLDEEKDEPLNNEGNDIMAGLEKSRDEEEEDKKDMESLASALHEVSPEAKEQLLSSHVESEKYETEISSLKEKVSLLEIANERQKGDFEEAGLLLAVAKEEASKLQEELKSLKSELEDVKEEKSSDEEKEGKKAMKSLESALHQVSSEAREAKDQLLSLHAERERLEQMLDGTKQDIDNLANLLEQSKQENQKLKDELMDSVKVYEEKNTSMEKEISRLVNLLQEAEEKASSLLKEDTYLKNSIKEMESEFIYLKEALGGAIAESKQLKESLMDKENELHNILQENEELRSSDAASLKRVEELTKSPEEASSTKQGEENYDLSESENGGEEEMPKSERVSQQQDLSEDEEKTEETETQKTDPDNTSEVEESDFSPERDQENEERDSSPDREQENEAFEDNLVSKAEGSENLDKTKGLHSAVKNLKAEASLAKLHSPKKKKASLFKFGSFLKKKGSSSEK